MQNTQDPHHPYPDQKSVTSELALENRWDSAAIRHLIRSKSGNGETPAFLLLGTKESAMLKAHLSEAFGEEAVVTLKGTHYMGLQVEEIQCESFVNVAGRKSIRTLQDPISRRPDWKNESIDSHWQLRLDR